MGVMKGQKYGSKSNARAGDNSKPRALAFSELRFVNLDLSPAEKEEFRNLLADGRFDAVPFNDWLANDFSFKLSLSKDKRSVVATLTCSNSEHVCGGGILSAFGGDAATAIAVLRYKDEVLSDENGWFAAEANRGKHTPDIG